MASVRLISKERSMFLTGYRITGNVLGGKKIQTYKLLL
jgi:hypothetical protein